MRPYLMGFFDTTCGSKVEASSYTEIAQALGTDSPAEILFATDNVKEAVAARQAGWQAVLVTRPGNADLTDQDKQQFPTISSMDTLLEQYHGYT